VSKESIIKKRLEKNARENPVSEQLLQPKKPKVLRPVMVRDRRKTNRKFFVLLGIWVVALAAALYFMTR
jgi:hypothetical protein